MYVLRSRRANYLKNVLYLLLFLLLYILFTVQQVNKNKGTKESSRNIEITTKELIPDIDTGMPTPDPEKSARQIFFIESTNPDGGVLELNPRQACSIESTAIFHPDRDIYVVFTGPTTRIVKENFTSMTDVLTKNYQNVFFRSANMQDIARGSPLDEFVRLKKYKDSKYYKTHVADMLRLLVLWKYGGLYFDLDIVVLHNFDSLKEDYVCKASDNFIMSGTMHFSGNGIGHTVVERWLIYFRDHFNGNKWAANGPEMLAAVMKDLCKTNNTNKMSPKNCQGMQVLRSSLFLPVKSHILYFKQKETNRVLKYLDVANAYTAHIYNHLNKHIKLTRNSKCAYLELAKKHCPNVYNAFDTYF